MDYCEGKSLEEIREMSDAPTILLLLALFIIFIVSQVFCDPKNFHY